MQKKVEQRETRNESLSAVAWPDDVHARLRELDVRQVGYVPDTGHARLIRLVQADRQMRAVALTTEEEGVAMAVGAWLGGERSVLLLQSSGAGNCINMLGMIEEVRVPLLMLVTMRGPVSYTHLTLPTKA